MEYGSDYVQIPPLTGIRFMPLIGGRCVNWPVLCRSPNYLLSYAHVDCAARLCLVPMEAACCRGSDSTGFIRCVVTRLDEEQTIEAPKANDRIACGVQHSDCC